MHEQLKFLGTIHIKAKYLDNNLFTTWDNMFDMCNRYNMSSLSVCGLQGEPCKSHTHGTRILYCTGTYTSK